MGHRVSWHTGPCTATRQPLHNGPTAWCDLGQPAAPALGRARRPVLPSRSPSGSPSTAGCTAAGSPRMAISIVLPNRCRQGPKMDAFSPVGPQWGWSAPAGAMPSSQSCPAHQQASKEGPKPRFPRPSQLPAGLSRGRGALTAWRPPRGQLRVLKHLPWSCPERPACRQGRGWVGSGRTGSGCGTSPETVPVPVTSAAAESGCATPLSSTTCGRPQTRQHKCCCTSKKAPFALMTSLCFKLHQQEGLFCQPPGLWHHALLCDRTHNVLRELPWPLGPSSR